MPDQHTAQRTEHIVTLYRDVFRAAPEQFSKRLVTRHVPIAAPTTRRTAGLARKHVPRRAENVLALLGLRGAHPRSLCAACWSG